MNNRDVRHQLASPPPQVQLVNTFSEPFNNAIATARTCYSSRVILAADVCRNEKTRAQRDQIAQSTYRAGHHTTLQHASFQFVLERVSRQLIWSFLHAHPFYNSEQVSQRYVEVRADRVLIPRLPDPAAVIFRATIDEQMACYRDLTALLTPTVATHYYRIFPGRKRHADDHAGEVKKRAQEIARYTLPIATFAHLYHTISGLTLHRYHRLCRCLDVPTETQLVVTAMVNAVNAVDPLFFAHIEDPIPLEETHEFRALATRAEAPGGATAATFCREFDRDLMGHTSRLTSYSPEAERQMAGAVRIVLGVPAADRPDRQWLDLLLAPNQNPYLSNALNLTSLGKISRAMAHAHYGFTKKLSHSADSQDQRHRMTPASRPVLMAQYAGGAPDLVVPHLLLHNAAALDRFMDSMTTTWRAIDNLLADGVAPEMAQYLLPNAFPIRFVESGDLAGLRHKWTTRLCLNAQEEIWRAAREEVAQVREVHPGIGEHQGPPCHLRHETGTKPYCPEGRRYCGVPVWRLDLDHLERIL